MADDAANPESVILIHGLWMHGAVFLPHQHRLEKLGFAARRHTYPSWSGRLAENVDRLATFIAACPAPRIHLIAHSLGGLVTLAMLEEGADRRIGRAVLMGTPCAACHCAETLATTPALSPLIGRCLADWLRRPHPPALPATIEIGTLAGTLGVGMGRLIPGLPKPNDGMIALAETRLDGASDSIALPVSHTGMLLSAACAKQAACFLKTGRFAHD